MKRVDRRRESTADRSPRSIIVWAAIGCLFFGLPLLAAGHDDNNLFLSVSGIGVLLGGGVLLVASLIFRRGQEESRDQTNPWRTRFRSLLVAAVFGCALATAGMLTYGLEFDDAMVARMGVLVMWLGIALFVPLVFLSPSKVTTHTHPEVVHLSISDLTDARSLGLEWPDDRPGLWVGIYDLNIVRSLDTRFLLANMPEDHRIFLAVHAWAVEEHKKLKKLLEETGDQYREEFERAGGDKWHTIFTSTRNEEVIRHVFEDYEFYYGSLASYPFIVAKGDLNVWMDSLRKLSKKGLKGVGPRHHRE